MKKILPLAILLPLFFACNSVSETRHAVTDTRILGYTCEQFEMDQQYASAPKGMVIASYLYSKDVLSVNKDYFKTMKFASFDKFIDEAEVFYLQYKGTIKFLQGNTPSSYTFTAINIKEQPVDLSIFAVDTTGVQPFNP